MLKSYYLLSHTVLLEMLSQEYIFLIFIIGMLIGVMIVNNCDDTQIKEISSYIGDFSDKLKTIGITSIQGLYMTSRKSILNIKGFTEKKVKNIFNEANKVEPYGFFQNGIQFNKEREDTVYKKQAGDYPCLLYIVHLFLYIIMTLYAITTSRFSSRIAR